MLGFDYEEDARARATDDQFLCGESLLAAPILTNQARGRMVYLPKGHFLHWNVRNFEDRSQVKVLSQGNHYIPCSLGETSLCLRENCLLPLADPGRHSDSFGPDLTILGFVTDKATFKLHWDDGISKSLKYRCILEIQVSSKGEEYSCFVQVILGDVKTLPWRKVHFEIHGKTGIYRDTKDIR
jgi:alpha-glucosidase